MRKLDLSAISPSIGMPLKSGSLQHIQDAYAEVVRETLKGLIGASYSSALVYILNGCVRSGSGSVFNITAGSVFYNGEVFLVNAASFTAAAGQTAIASISVLYVASPSMDGVQFTDGVTRNIHQNRIMTIASGATGSGIGVSFTAWQRINANIAQLNLSSSNTGALSISGTYPNIVLNPGATALKVFHAGVTHVGDINPSGGTSIGISFADIATTSYMVAGGTESLSNLSNDTQVVWTVDQSTKTSTGFTVHFQETQAVTQDINFAWAIIALG